MGAARVSVIIVNYNSAHRLRKCLDCLAGQTWSDFETIIVDNNSDDGSLEAARTHAIAPKILALDENVGFAEGNNKAVALATGEWLGFLNPDAYADPAWLATLVQATEQYPEIAAFGSTQLDATNPQIIDGAGDVCHAAGIAYRGHFGWPRKLLPTRGSCFSPCAAAALYRRDVFEKLNGFDQRFFCYGEDVDLGFRLRLSGGEIGQVAKAVVHHEGSGVTGRHSDFSIYYGTRNRIWLFYKNLPMLLYLGLMPVHLIFNILMLVRAGAGGTGGAFWRGMIDGYKRLSEFNADRRDLQSTRKLSVWQIAQLMTWSPLKLMRRQADLRMPNDVSEN